MQTLTIRELEETSGVPRSTIYFYVREGLLPIAQKAAASRAVYSETHLELLRQISQLKDRGPARCERSGSVWLPKVASAGAMDVDLVAEQAEQIRQSILVAAARLFARRGYKRTRVVDIIRGGRHAAGLLQPLPLQAGAVRRVVRGVRRVDARLPREPAAGRSPIRPLRNLARVHGYFGVQALSPDLMALVRSEGLHEDDDMRKAVERSYKDMCRDTLEDLVGLRERGRDRPAGVGRTGGLLVCWARGERSDAGLLGRPPTPPRTFSGRLSASFWRCKAVYTGRLDVSKELVRYAGMIERLASESPPVPPDALS